MLKRMKYTMITLETIENPKDLILNIEKALDSGINEDEEYYDPMTMEPVPGATENYGIYKQQWQISGIFSSISSTSPNNSISWCF